MSAAPVFMDRSFHEAVLRISTNSRAHSDLKEVSLLAGKSVSFLLLR